MALVAGASTVRPGIHGGHGRDQRLRRRDVTQRAVVQRPVGLDVAEGHTLGAADLPQLPDLLAHPELYVTGRGAHFNPTEILSIRITRVGTHGHASGVRRTHGGTHEIPAAGVLAARHVCRGHGGEELGVGPRTFAEVGVQIDVLHRGNIARHGPGS